MKAKVELNETDMVLCVMEVLGEEGRRRKEEKRSEKKKIIYEKSVNTATQNSLFPSLSQITTTAEQHLDYVPPCWILV